MKKLLLLCTLLCTFLFYGCEKEVLNINGNENVPISLRELKLLEVNNGILTFSTKKDLSNYFESISKLSDIDKNNLENNLRFQSLQSKYNTNEEIDYNYKNTIPFSIEDPLLANIMNEYHEFAVEGIIYKFVSKGIYTYGEISKINKFIEMRNTNAITRTG